MSDSAISFALIQAEKRSRFDPLKDLTPERLVTYMDEFRAGHFQNLARVMDTIEERDDTLISVVPKAKAAVARHGFEILTVDTDSDEEAALAERQREELEFFYNNLRATSALDQDENGGMSLLLRQMMDAKGKRYAVHNIVWQPKLGGRYTANFIQAPLWFFESTVGKLRFISQPFGFYGEDMERGAWLVTKGEGLMIACSIAWMYKRIPLRDWLIYCGRHGMPGIEGITDAAKDSDEWKLVEQAVEAAYSEFKWVRNRNSEIKTIDFSAQGELPYAPLVERMDRALVRIWRGGDLSTMSKDGAAVGANPQQSETINIEEDDAAWLSETLQLKVDRLVLDYIFGEDAPTLAYVKILTTKKQNTELDLKIDDFAVRNGHPLSQKQFAERYNRPLPDEDDALLTAPTAPTINSQNYPPSTPPDATAANEDQQRSSIVNAFAADLQPVRAELAAILQITDDVLREVKLRAFLDRIEQLKKELPVASETQRALAQVIGSELASALARPTAANSDEQPRVPAGSSEGGQFTYADAVGKTGDWKQIGLPHARWVKADALQLESNPREAESKLRAGFTVQDYAGRELKFGSAILDHWGEKAKRSGETDRRLRRLADAVETAKQPREVFDQVTGEGGQRAYFRASQDEKGRRRYHFGFLADAQGNVHTFFHSDRASTANQIRKGKLIHGRD